MNEWALFSDEKLIENDGGLQSDRAYCVSTEEHLFDVFFVHRHVRVHRVFKQEAMFWTSPVLYLCICILFVLCIWPAFYHAIIKRILIDWLLPLVIGGGLV